MASIQDILKNWSSSVSAGTRYIVAFIGGAGAAAGLAGMKPEDVTKLADFIQQIGSGISTLMTTTGTVVAAAVALYGMFKSTKAQQVVTANKIEGVSVAVDASTAPTSVVKVALKTDEIAISSSPPPTPGATP